MSAPLLFPISTLSRTVSLLALACTVVCTGALPPQAAMARTPSHAAAPAPQPGMAQRYATADRFLYDGMSDLLDNADIAPRFTENGLFYRTGNRHDQHYRYLDLATQKEREITSTAKLLAALSQATGGTVSLDDAAIWGVEYDPAQNVVTFSALKARWRMDASGKASKEQPAKAAPGLLSPDGKTRIVARDYNLIAVDVASGREVPLTTDGTREQPYGRSIPQLADILREGTEEPEMPVSAQWSPDGRYLLSWRLDTRGVKKLSMTQENPPGSFYPRSFSYIYPLAGANVLPQAARFTVDVKAALRTGKATIVPIEVPSESLLYPAPPDMGWVNGKAHMTWTERGYKQQVVYEADPATGKATIVAREAVKPVITVTSSMIFPAPELGGELSISERTGWAQLYLVTPDAPDGGKALTTGEWEVLSVDHIAEDKTSLVVTGVGREADRNPYWRALYRVPLAGGALTELTPEPLDHDTRISPDGQWIVDQMSSPTTATRAVLRDGKTGRIVRELARADDSRLLAAGYTPPEPFKGLAADGKTPIYGMIYRPANFDPHHSYPVIDNVYTGPTTTDVPATWSMARRVAGNSVAQIGAIVVMIDGTGTSRRGQAFRLPAFENLGEVGLDDHIALIRQMAAKYPYMDVDRVGVFGGSAGGYDTARFVLRRPDFYKVGVASSGNHDLRLDKAWWPEVSMGYADQATWERNSNMSVASQLKGHLLLIHGDIDDNVPVTESFRLAKALIDAGRDVDMVVLPNTTHRVYQPFFWKKLRDYFTRYLLDEAPPPLSSAKTDAPGATH
ncbi:S9 family peptidase [Novosphingobium beihaiensis]|uniref:Prolyl oligopeptidase family serine peptidase n=1 Tax=Novosphingobium beihaiensis TaxID=2930389 RepID=A0ABT0BL45_9SPHN|nr:DPP IV N-terminal domain-containing protein [Novosphingobium beihaiensis]MCJ2185777.1 prolyl oligopeptidase family serine peptidase [Novosphingobium beihaiensis]